MANVNDLEADAKVKKAKAVHEAVQEVDEISYLRQDILDSISLNSKAMHLLDYLSDHDLCKSITKRERESMSRMSDKIREFLDEAESAYTIEEE